MRHLSAETRVLDETKSGPVLEVRLSGHVESRPGGIASLVESSLSETPSAAVVFDLTDLRYVSWDDIGVDGIVAATNGFARPTCIVSRGRNRKNLGQLLDVTQLGTLLGGQVFPDSVAALEHIREVLRTRPA